MPQKRASHPAAVAHTRDAALHALRPLRPSCQKHKSAARCQRLPFEKFHQKNCGGGGVRPLPALRSPHWRRWRRLLQGSALSSQAGVASLNQSALQSPILGGRRSCGATSVGHRLRQAASPEARCTGKGRRRLRRRRPKAHLGRLRRLRLRRSCLTQCCAARHWRRP